MRLGARSGVSSALFNMSRTDMAGIAMLVAVLVFLAVAVSILRE